MDLNKILNIRNLNIKEEIEKTVNETKEELHSLTTNQTCKIYSSYIKENLDNKTILNKLINSKEIFCNYEHEFVIVPDNEDFYLIDLTYPQFGKDNYLSKLYNDGYQKMNEEEWKYYLKKIDNTKYISLEEIIYGSKKKTK